MSADILATGRRRHKSKSGFATRRDAESALHEYIRDLVGGGDPCLERIALAEYLRRWLDYQRARGIRSRTLQGYEGYIRREIVPVIGGLELARIRPGHARVALARMHTRGLSATTIAQVRSVLGSALRQAVEDGLITANPVTAVKRPRVQRPEPHWPIPSQLRALLEASQETVWEVPILLAAATGARRSEVLGISWQDLDLRGGTVLIRRGVQPLRRAEGAQTIPFTPLKTKRAHRQVQLPPFALERIRRHRREQLECRSHLGAGGATLSTHVASLSPWSVIRGDGWPLYPDSFTRSFKRLAHQAGMHPATRLHDVRHAVATELGRQGVDPVIVSAVLGHASPAFTVAVYQHAWQEGPSEAAAALEGALSSRPSDVGNPLAPEEPEGSDERVRRDVAGQVWWGGQDLNQRPTDHESVPGRFADLLRPTKWPLTCGFGSRSLPDVSGRFGCSRGFRADSLALPRRVTRAVHLVEQHRHGRTERDAPTTF
jgi:integrase